MHPATSRLVQRLPERPNRQSQAFFLLLLAGIAYLTYTVFKPFLIYMMVGLFVAVLALPIDKFWERLLPNRVAAFATMGTLFLIVTVPLVALGFALASDVQEISQTVRSGEAEASLESALEVLLPGQTAEQRNATMDQIWGEIEPVLNDALRKVGRALVGFVGDIAIAFTVILFVLYYVLVDGQRLAAYLRRAAPMPATHVDFLLHEAKNGLNAVFVGQIMTSLIQGALGGIGFLIAGLEGAVLWAAVMAILSLLPVIGAFLVWLPAAIFLLSQGDTWQGVFLIIWGVVVVSQVDNLIRPRLIGDRADIHPLFVLIGVLGGVAAFGFVGLFLGPLLVGVLLSVLKVWEADYLDPMVGALDATAAPPAAVKDPPPAATKSRAGKKDA